MSLLGFEGFDNWTTVNTTTEFTNASNPPWLIQMIASAYTAGTLGGKRIQCANGGWFQVFFTAVASLVCGARVMLGTTVGTKEIFNFHDSANAVQCGLTTNSSGKLTFWRGTTATVLATGATTIIADSDYFIEVKVEFSNSANVTVRINGVDEITLSAVDTTNTANNNCGSIRCEALQSNSQYHDDFYVCDLTGSAPFNNFLGGAGASFTGVRVETTFVTTDNSVTWTPLSSTNASNVDEIAQDGDTSYNKSGTPGQIDTFNHGSLSSSPASIFAAKVQSFVRKEDVVNRTYRNKFISGGTTVNGTSIAVSGTYQMAEDYYITDPNTAAAWASASAVNNTKIGYELVT